MKTKTFFITIFLILAAIALAGVFYWQSIKNPQEFVYQNNEGEISPAPLPKSTENEIAISTPFIIKGEISRGNPNKKQIIFTFDGGAGINSGQKILEITEKHNVKTTFFITGKFAQQNPDLIKQMATEGHEIFNHTYSHPHLTQITDKQIKEEFLKTENIVKGLTGITTKPFFRPPFGERNSHILEFAGAEGYQSVYWTADALDWMSEKTAEEVKTKIYSNLKNGAIILMHIGDDITGNVLDEIFTKIKNDGYQIVNLSEGIK